MDKSSKNYLAIGGSGNEALFSASEAMGVDPYGAVTTKRFTRGCMLLGPEGTDTERCVVLVTGLKDGPEAWWLIDYRTVIPEQEINAHMEVLRNKLRKVHPEFPDYVRIESTQDLVYRQKAVKFLDEEAGK